MPGTPARRESLTPCRSRAITSLIDSGCGGASGGFDGRMYSHPALASDLAKSTFAARIFKRLGMAASKCEGLWGCGCILPDYRVHRDNSASTQGTKST